MLVLVQKRLHTKNKDYTRKTKTTHIDLHISYYIKDKLDLFIIHTLRFRDLTLSWYNWYVCISIV
jgi:hypothetical protein